MFRDTGVGESVDMAHNVEIKARLRDVQEQSRLAASLSDGSPELIAQEDTFFNVDHGRLKLRLLDPNHGQLIFYERPNQDGPKRSDYLISEASDPENLKHVLELAYGIRGVVKKTRLLYLAGQTRIHLDDVQGLGHFMELEVVMRDGQSDEEGQAVAEDLMQKLGVQKEDLIEGAYMDLIESRD